MGPPKLCCTRLWPRKRPRMRNDVCEAPRCVSHNSVLSPLVFSVADALVLRYSPVNQGVVQFWNSSQNLVGSGRGTGSHNTDILKNSSAHIKTPANVTSEHELTKDTLQRHGSDGIMTHATTVLITPHHQ